MSGSRVPQASEFLKMTGVPFKTLESYLADGTWTFPAAFRIKSKSLHRIFSAWRNPSGEDAKIRGSASELFGLYGLLRHFVETRSVAFEIARGTTPLPDLKQRPARLLSQRELISK